MTDRRSSVRRLCQQGQQLGTRAEAAGELDAFEALVAAARAGADVEDERAALADRLGVPEPRSTRTLTGVLGVDGGHTITDLYVCPAGLCSRTWLNVPGKGDPPACAIAGTALVKA